MTPTAEKPAIARPGFTPTLVRIPVGGHGSVRGAGGDKSKMVSPCVPGRVHGWLSQGHLP